MWSSKHFQNMFNVPNYPTRSYADPQIRELTKLEDLTIPDYPLSPNLYRMTPAEEAQYNLSETCLEEVVVDKIISPSSSEKMSENVVSKENSAVWSPTDTLTFEITEFVCPPELCTKTQKTKKKEPDYDSDDTCDDYVECGEKGKCKCQRMWGREYYEYYARNQDKDLHTLYPQGRCVLPKGAVFHFTGAPSNMKREDVKEALVGLGAKIEFVDYNSGNKEGWVRLSFPHEARIIIKKMIDKKLNISGADIEFRVLSGKDEKRYHKKAIESIYQLQQKAKGLQRKLRKAGYSYVKKYNPE